MEISLEQINDFNFCPMLYKFKYQMKIDRTFIGVDQKCKDALKKTVLFFYYQILNGKEPSPDQLRQKFGNIFFDGQTTEDILAGSTLDRNMNALSLEAVKSLQAFYEKEASRKFVPIMVDSDLRISVGDNQVLVTIDLVREMQYVQDHPKIELVAFTSTSRKIDPFRVNHDFKLSAYSYGFREMFQEKEDRLILQSIRQGKEYFSLRKDSELKRFETVVASVTDSIRKEKFYPVHNHMCNSCSHKDVCDKYKF